MQIKIEIVGSELELQKVLSVLAGTSQAQTATHKTVTSVKDEPIPATKKVKEVEQSETTEEETTEEETTEEETPKKASEPSVTFEELRETISKINKTPDRKGKALINKHGFAKLEELRTRKDKWDEIYEEAKKS